MPRQPLGKHSSTRSHAAGPSARNRHDLGPSRQPHVAEAYVWRGAHQQTAKGQSRSLGTRKVKTQTCCRQAASKRGHPLSHSQPTGKWEGRGPPHLKGPRAVGLQPSEPQLSTCWGETTPQGRHADETEAQGKRLANYGGHTDVGGGVLEENPTAQIKGEAGSLPSRAGRQGGQLWGARTRPRLLPQELREARQDPGRSRHSAPPAPHAQRGLPWRRRLLPKGLASQTRGPRGPGPRLRAPARPLSEPLSSTRVMTRTSSRITALVQWGPPARPLEGKKKGFRWCASSFQSATGLRASVQP